MKTIAGLVAGAVLICGTAAASPPGPHGRFAAELDETDSNNDGFISRTEAQAAAARQFDRMDRNDDGKLDAADRDHLRARGPDEGGPGGPGNGQDGREERRERLRGEGPRHGHGQGHGRGHHGRHMGMAMLLHGEFDRNNDKALSQEEFVSGQLRFFDAADVTGDGKIALPERPSGPPAGNQKR